MDVVHASDNAAVNADDDVAGSDARGGRRAAADNIHDLSTAVGQIKEGRLLALAVSTSKRSPQFPDIPTIAEAGFPKAEFNFWVGMLAPAGTPPAVIERLNSEVSAAPATPEIKQRLASLGADAAPMPAADFDKLIAQELVENAALAKEAGIKPQ